jgi:hypothetical protein
MGAVIKLASDMSGHVLVSDFMVLIFGATAGRNGILPRTNGEFAPLEVRAPCLAHGHGLPLRCMTLPR